MPTHLAPKKLKITDSMPMRLHQGAAWALFLLFIYEKFMKSVASFEGLNGPVEGVEEKFSSRGSFCQILVLIDIMGDLFLFIRVVHRKFTISGFRFSLKILL